MFKVNQLVAYTSSSTGSGIELAYIAQVSPGKKSYKLKLEIDQKPVSGWRSDKYMCSLDDPRILATLLEKFKKLLINLPDLSEKSLTNLQDLLNSPDKDSRILGEAYFK